MNEFRQKSQNKRYGPRFIKEMHRQRSCPGTFAHPATRLFPRTCVKGHCASPLSLNEPRKKGRRKKKKKDGVHSSCALLYRERCSMLCSFFKKNVQYKCSPCQTTMCRRHVNRVGFFFLIFFFFPYSSSSFFSPFFSSSFLSSSCCSPKSMDPTLCHASVATPCSEVRTQFPSH